MWPRPYLLGKPTFASKPRHKRGVQESVFLARNRPLVSRTPGACSNDLGTAQVDSNLVLCLAKASSRSPQNRETVLAAKAQQMLG
jgi:hypothetical protein